MSDWGIALIAAGSALAGSVVTGLFGRSAGDRQAEAARATARMTLEEQRAARVLELRRQTYVGFLQAAEAVLLTQRTGEGLRSDRADLQRVLGAVSLEGPEEVAGAARELVDRYQRGRSPDELEEARADFVRAARGALRDERPHKSKTRPKLVRLTGSPGPANLAGGDRWVIGDRRAGRPSSTADVTSRRSPGFLDFSEAVVTEARTHGGRYGKALAAIGAATALAAVAAAPAGAATPARGGERYVALGDSYTSGPGIPSQSGGDCARSSVNYPSLTAKALKLKSFKDVSCSGAKTDDMWRAQGANAPQLNALGKHTRIVTVGIGGNDIGFSEIIGTCVKLSVTDPAGAPCRKQYTAGGTDQLTARVNRAAPKVARVLKAIHQRAPHARVVLAGYPSIMPDNGVGCFPSVPVAAGDVPYLRNAEKRLNAMLKAQAGKAHVRYADTYRATVGHDVCQPQDKRWIEGARPGRPAAPFHPNADGERAMSRPVLAELRKH